MTGWAPVSGPVLEAFGYTCARQNPTVTLLPDAPPLNAITRGPTTPGAELLAIDIWGGNRYFYLIEHPTALARSPP